MSDRFPGRTFDAIRERVDGARIVMAKFGTDGAVTVAHRAAEDMPKLIAEIDDLRAAIALISRPNSYNAGIERAITYLRAEQAKFNPGQIEDDQPHITIGGYIEALEGLKA